MSVRSGRGLSRRHLLARGAAACALALAASACQTGLSGGGTPAGQPADDAVIGTGDIAVALLLPFGASGAAGSAGRALRNAAELAMSEVQDPAIRLLPIDTGGSAEGARAAAEQAIAAGAGLILGPLLAGAVQAVGQVARPAGVPVIGFADDPGVAASGVYLLSFLPGAEIERVVAHAAAGGRRSFAALLPEGGYGAIVEAALRQSAPRHGARVVSIARYADAGDAGAAVAATAAVAGGAAAQADAVLVPDGAGALARLLPALRGAGVTADRVALLGSGRWNDPEVWRIPEAAGGRFPAPDPAGFAAFAEKYRARFGAPPPRIASLAYDAVSLAAALGRIGGPDGFGAQVLTNADGFAGVDGVFRFRRNGLNERGLAILEVQAGQAVPVDPAPGAFGG